MINIILTVLIFNVIVILFKLLPKYNVVSMHAITINYFVASTCGFIYSDSSFDISEILSSAWIFHALIIGSIFMLVFYLLAIGTQKVGITISTVANKMSLIIPVAVSIIWYDSDQFSWIKLAGILIALTSVYLTTTNEGKTCIRQKVYMAYHHNIFISRHCRQSLATPKNRS